MTVVPFVCPCCLTSGESLPICMHETSQEIRISVEYKWEDHIHEDQDIPLDLSERNVVERRPNVLTHLVH
jgi:hypothetical protein